MEQPQPQNPDQETGKRSSIFSPLHVAHKVKQNLVFRSKWAELNGAMGDLGTYIPIILALTLSKNLNLGTTLIFTGIYNFVTGSIYGVPMPVQPMKSIAAVAISNPNFNIPELAQGLSFAMTAVKYIRKVQNFAKSKAAGDRPWMGLDGLLLALICACFIIIVNGSGDESENENREIDLEMDDLNRRASKMRKLRKIIASLPSAFLIFLLGLVLAVIRGPKAVKEFKFGPSSIEIIKISKNEWKEGSSLVRILDQFPVEVLGVLLLFAGIELAICCRDMNSKEECFVMLICAAVSLVGSSAALGFLCGMVVHLLVRLRRVGDGQSWSTFWFH
ncbi:hypothetical protein DH2020_046798 [Rehmannia glutinosa]|uniref:Uncharacterized protein n=1 Tax=Rehmannia glutinosa TaxID=99300 RepID=A0ABR0UAY0_REHGL